MKRKTKKLLAVMAVLLVVALVLACLVDVKDLFGKDKDPDPFSDPVQVDDNTLTIESKKYTTRFVYDETSNVYRFMIGFEGLEEQHNYRIVWKCNSAVFENSAILPSKNGDKYAMMYSMTFTSSDLRPYAEIELEELFYTLCEAHEEYLSTGVSTCFAISFWQVSGDTSLAERHALRALIEQSVEIYLYG